MNDLVTQKGLELEHLSPGDIVTSKPRNPKIVDSSIYRVITANAHCVVLERMEGLFKGERSTQQMNANRWFEASELLQAVGGE